MLPYQSELLSMSMSVVGMSLLGTILSAWLFRNVFTLKLILGSLVLGIIMIFVTLAIAGTEQTVLILGSTFFFGACTGATLGGFTIAVTHEHPRAKEVIGVTIGLVAICTLTTAAVGMFSGVNFQWLDNYLFIGLLILISVGIFQIIFRVSKKTDLIIGFLASTFWVVYLLHNFNKIVDKYETATWRAAVEIGMSVYLDIINLFVRLLPLIAELLEK